MTKNNIDKNNINENFVFDISDNLIDLNKIITQNGFELYIVGGFVRNSILKIATNDIDICGNATSSDIINILEGSVYKTQIINEKLGTVLVSVNGEHFEYTTFRKESYECAGEHEPSAVEFITDIKEDAKRRDFTVNAIYLNLNTMEIIDFYSGISDIKNKVIRCIENPEFVFKSDGLRILRFIRFVLQLDFEYDKKTYKTAKEKSYLLKDISKERILKELKLILNSDSAYGIFGNQHNKAVKIFNDFNIYQYIFNSQFKKFKIKLKGVLYKGYLQSNNSYRYFSFVCLVIGQYFKINEISYQQLEFVINTILGQSGLKESKTNINKIIKLFKFIQSLLNKNSANYKDVIEFSHLSDSLIDYFNILNAGKMKKIIETKTTMEEENIPFNIGQLNITATQLISEGIVGKNISKIMAILFNECLNGKFKNQYGELLFRAKVVNNNLVDVILGDNI